MQIIQWERKGGIYHLSLEKEEGRLEKTLSWALNVTSLQFQADSNGDIKNKN